MLRKKTEKKTRLRWLVLKSGECRKYRLVTVDQLSVSFVCVTSEVEGRNGRVQLIRLQRHHDMPSIMRPTALTTAIITAVVVFLTC